MPASIDAVRLELTVSLHQQVTASLITSLAQTQCERDIWRERAMKAEADCVASKEKMAPQPEILSKP